MQTSPIKPRPYTLRTQQMVILLLAGAVPLTILLLLTNWFMKDRLRDQAYERMEAALTVAHAQLLDRVSRHMREARALGGHPLLYGEDGTNPAEGLAHVRNVYGIFQRDVSRLTLYGLSGLPLEFTTSENLRSRASTASFQKAVRGEPSATHPHLLQDSRELVTALYFPVRNREGVVRNVVRQYVPIRNLAVDLQVQPGVTWITGSGEWLAGGREMAALSSFTQVYPDWQAGPVRGMCKNREGQDQLFVQTRLDSLEILAGGQLVLMEPADQALASLNDLHRFVLITGIASFGVLVLLALFASHRIARPLRKAAEAAAHVADGKLDTTLKCAGSSELRQLATTLNIMTAEVRNRRTMLEVQVQERTKRLHDVNAYLHAIMDGLKDALVVSDLQNQGVHFANRAARELFDIAEDADLSVYSDWQTLMEQRVRNPADWEAFRESVETSTSSVDRLFSLDFKGIKLLEIMGASVTGEAGEQVGLLWMFRDVSERERLEAEIRQIQKLEAVGRLAGGIAHDFNNILTAIQGGLELTQVELENGEDPTEWVDSSLAGCKRAAEVTQQLLSFSRQRPLDLTPVDLNDASMETTKLLKNTIDPRIKIKTHFAPHLARVTADDGQLQQVLMNIMINACHAMPEGGTLFIRSFLKHIDEDEVSVPYAYAGNFSCIEIRDTGEGMTDEVRAKIFDPFFTTKPQGRGTGLGLATSLGIVQRHKGWVECESTPGRGSSFTIHLPAIAEQYLAQDVFESPIPIQSALAAHILLVDDEAVIRRSARSMLMRAGHTIDEAENGMVALKKLEATTKAYDLVILDLSMPELSGAETFRRIRLHWPEIPVLIWSGYSQDAVSLFEASDDAQPDAFLAKPFRTRELNDKVSDLIREIRISKKSRQASEVVQRMNPDSRSDLEA